MKKLLTAMLIFSCTATRGAEPPNVLPTDADRAVSAAFLVELTNPARMPTYRVGLVYAEMGIGLMVSPKGAPLVVEYIADADATRDRMSRGLFGAAVEQVGVPQPTSFRFRVVRKVLTADNCPMMVSGFADFYQELERALAVPVNLADPPPGSLGIANTHGDYRIQVKVFSAVLSLDRVSELRHPLAQAVNPLIPVVRDCADGITPAVQQDYSFSYGQAILQPTTR